MNNSVSFTRNRFTYARITSFTIDELPIERVEGRITSGSVNIDGASAVRRTCSLGMVSDGTNINEYNWTLNTKFLLEAGILSETNEIIWFKQGVFVLTSFSVSFSTNNCTINLQGKDKMCKLNGENGGMLASEVDFGNFQEVDKQGNIRVIQRTLKEIIRDAVHYYGGEPLHNIIINDLDNRGVQLQEYRYSTPLYLIRQSASTNYVQGTLDGQLQVYVKGTTTTTATPISALDHYDSLISSEFGGIQGANATEFALSPDSGAPTYCATKIEYGQTLGYTTTEMVYNGELIGGINESVTSILDKIKQLLGNFEYFYDVDGRFIFQEQENYINTSWSPLQETSEGFVYVDPMAQKTQFEFTDTSYFTAFNISPNISNVKNDYSIWGTRKGAGGGDVKIHLRYAIDQKPVEYTTIEVTAEDLKDYNEKYNLDTKPQEPKLYITSLVEGMTYYENNSHTLFLPDPGLKIDENVISNFGDGVSSSALEIDLDQDEFTVIEKYCDWRELIYQMACDYYKYGHLDDFALRVAKANPQLFPSGSTGYEQYYIDMFSFWRQLYSYDEDEHEVGIEYYKDGEAHPYWNKAVYEKPEQLNFWFDFLDLHGELEQFSVRQIGRRPKVVDDKDVKAIYYRETPEIIYTSSTGSAEDANTYTGYTRLNVGQNFSNMFTASSQGKSAKSALDTLLYNHTYCTESISITSVPIYELEPNKRIYVRDEDAGIDGEYIVSKLTMPLAYNGTMSITATRAVDRII